MKRFLSIALAAIMAVTVGVMNFSAASTITTSGGNGDSQVQLTYGNLVDTDGDGTPDTPEGGANFNVTVPTVLPFFVDADGVVTTASTAPQITNNGNGPVEVTAVAAETVNGWQIVANGTDFKAVPVNSKQFTMSIMGDNFPANATRSELPSLGSAWTVINGQASLPLTYDGDFAVQSNALDASHIANVIFTIGWHTAA